MGEVVNVVPSSQHISTNNPVRVLATSGQPQQLCYICKRDNKEDLFYCSSCGDNFHQFCLQLQSPGSGQTVSTTCGRCRDTKGDYEQAMNARAESIHAKCEEIDGAQYQQAQEQSNGGNKLYDNDFNSYLQIPEISL